MCVGWDVSKWESFKQRNHMCEDPQMGKRVEYFRKRSQSRMTGISKIRENIFAIWLIQLLLEWF